MSQSLRRLGRVAVVVPGIAAALTLTGCKNGQTSSEQPSDSASPSPSASQPASAGSPGVQSPGSQTPGAPASSGKTKLTITVRASKSAKAVTHTLTCDPVGGDLPNAKIACAVLDKARAARTDPFAPTPTGQMCTQIYGGPEVATVTGTWNGKKVDTRFGRKNGCELKRWGDLAVLFGPVPPVR